MRHRVKHKALPLPRTHYAIVNAIELVSPFPPDECVARLVAAIDHEGLLFWRASLFWRGSMPVIGRVTGRSLRLRKQIGYLNSCQTLLTGTLAPQGQGSVFRGTTGMHPFVPVFVWIWFAFIAIIGIVTAVIAAVQWLSGGVGQPIRVIALATSAMIPFGVVLLCVCRMLAQGEKEFLVAFLRDVLAADDVTHEP